MVNRLVGWAGRLVTSIAVAMSLFHLYAAVAGAWPFTDFPIIATQPLRYAHVAFVLMLSFLLFPLSARFRDRIRWWDIAAGIMRGDPPLRHRGRRGIHRPRHHADPSRRRARRGMCCCSATRRTTGWIVPFVAVAFLAYAYFGPYLPAPWTHRGYDVSQPVGHLFITLEGIFGIPVDVVLADHSVHDLRRLPAAFRRRQVLHRLLHGAHGPQAQQRRPHRGAGIVPARRAVRLRRRHHGDDRRGRLSADAARASRRTPPAGCSPPAGSAPSSRRRCWAPPPS